MFCEQSIWMCATSGHIHNTYRSPNHPTRASIAVVIAIIVIATVVVVAILLVIAINVSSNHSIGLRPLIIFLCRIS
jgi:signal transduction histidine kinase